MGEFAEMALDGIVCQVCGEFMGDVCGYPRTCNACARTLQERPPVAKVKCPICGKKVKVAGLADHQRDVHGGGQ